MKRLLKNMILVVALLGLCGLGATWYQKRGQAEAVTLRTAPVVRGPLVSAIRGITGTVEPEEQVDVGAQVAGQINSFGKDQAGKSIDYGSEVEVGTVLAEIDDSLYQAALSEASAQLSQAKAGLEHAVADLAQMKVKLEQAQRDWERAQRLGPSEALAETSFDAYRFGYLTARANVEVGQAAVDQARASVTQAEAVLKRAQRNLGYCTIKSPVKGVIIDRRVNIGQTVVSSLNAPSLFLIAKDLRHMQVWASVNEADIGSVHPGQPVTFSVAAFPDEVFHGEVGKVRLNATMTQNVVTYTVEVTTDNSSGRLLPYLTADLQFELERKENVLQVPNAALRWSPSRPELVAPEYRARLAAAGGSDGDSPRRRSMGSGPHVRDATPVVASAAADAAPGKDSGRGQVWVRDGEFVRPIEVRVGLADGGTNMTEVEGRDLSEGLEVVVGEEAPAGGASPTGGTTNPFVPQMRRSRPQPGPPSS